MSNEATNDRGTDSTAHAVDLVQQSVRYGELIERRARRQPDAVAFVCEDVTISYGDLLDRADRIQVALAIAGVGPLDRIVCYSENSPDVIAGMLAALRVGAVFCPIGASSTLAEVSTARTRLDAHVVMCSPSLFPAAEQLGAQVVIPLDQPTDHVGHTVAEPHHSHPGDTALILFTSGSTGSPKGVELSHQALFFSTMNNLLGLDFTADDVALIFTPLSHAAALITLAGTTLHKGGTIVLQSKFDPDRALDLIDRHRVTVLFAVPATLTLMERSPHYAHASLSSIRWILGGGAAFAPEQIARWESRGIPVISSFGMTEAGPSVSFRRIGDVALNTLSSGTPGLFTELRVRVRDRDADISEIGEILVRGPHTAVRYWRSADESARAFHDGWLVTGDRGYLDERGELHITGRTKDLIITGGENVDPVEVEHSIGEFPNVIDAAVVGRPDELWGERVTAIVVASTVFELGELRGFLATRLAGYKIPRELEFRDSLPRNPLGKLIRSAL